MEKTQEYLGLKGDQTNPRGSLIWRWKVWLSTKISDFSLSMITWKLIFILFLENHKMTSLKFQIGIYNSVWLIKLLSSRKFCLYPYSLITGLIKSKILRQAKCFLFLFHKSIEVVTKLIFGCLDSNQKYIENNGSSLLLFLITLSVHFFLQPHWLTFFAFIKSKEF